MTTERYYAGIREYAHWWNSLTAVLRTSCATCPVSPLPIGFVCALTNMDDISQLLLGPQRSTGSTFGVVLTVIATALAGALMIYLLRCYIQETLIRRRIRQRVHQPCGGNIVLAEFVPCGKALSQTNRVGKKLSTPLPVLPRNDGHVKHRRRSTGHPWKRDYFRSDSPTPQ
jgi:hypothetical protein